MRGCHDLRCGMLRRRHAEADDLRAGAGREHMRRGLHQHHRSGIGRRCFRSEQRGDDGVFLNRAVGQQQDRARRDIGSRRERKRASGNSAVSVVAGVAVGVSVTCSTTAPVPRLPGDRRRAGEAASIARRASRFGATPSSTIDPAAMATSVAKFDEPVDGADRESEGAAHPRRRPPRCRSWRNRADRTGKREVVFVGPAACYHPDDGRDRRDAAAGQCEPLHAADDGCQSSPVKRQ